MIPSYYVYPGLPPTPGISLMIKYGMQRGIPDVARIVCEYFNVSHKDMYSRFKGNRYICDARKVVCYLCYTILKKSSTDIGRGLGRDHTTVITAIRATRNLMETDEGFSNHVYALSKKVIQ
jgi:chromosomal replication initiator protein